MRRSGLLASAVASLFLVPGMSAALTLANAPGDGQVSVGLDSYGSFGYQTTGGSGTGDAKYDPVGPTIPSTTTWQSAVYFRKSGSSKFLSTGMVGKSAPSGSLPDGGFSASDATHASSTFAYAGLDFSLEQHLDDAFDGTSRVGSVLTQTYTITNPGAAPVSFDLVRYYEGDLFGTVADGGGHLVIGPTEYVFETDTAGEPALSTSFVGITAVGGMIPTTGRYEVGQWPGFPDRITADMPLGDVVHNDGADPDMFVDAGMDYDVGIALANHFEIPAGGNATYVTTTRFGTGAPADVPGVTTTTTAATTTTTTTVPGACVAAPTFASILCRLDLLIAQVSASADLGKFKASLGRELARARRRTALAETRAGGAKARTALGPLRDAIQAVGGFVHRLNSNNARKKLGGSVRTSFTDPANAIHADMQTLLGQLRPPH